MALTALCIRTSGIRWSRGSLLAIFLAGGTLLFCGCDQLTGLVATPVHAKTAEDDIAAFLTYQDALVGKTATEVEEVFGKPKGIFERRSGTTWMYSRWRVEFDSAGSVRSLERDIAATRSGEKGAAESMALAPGPVPTSAAAPSGNSIVRIANGGQRVDLKSVMPSGKVVVVDFYADWCGPCRRIAPHLEALAKDDPDLVLVKVDIVKWGTPVTDQYKIHSVPNVRVFDRNGSPIGQPTSSFSQIQANVKKAGA
jgi:thioredoxin 1